MAFRGIGTIEVAAEPPYVPAPTGGSRCGVPTGVWQPGPAESHQLAGAGLPRGPVGPGGPATYALLLVMLVAVVLILLLAKWNAAPRSVGHWWEQPIMPERSGDTGQH